MQKKPLKILGISPGTRYIGFALFCGSELRDWGVRNIEGRWSKEKMKKTMAIISGLIGQSGTNVLSIKELHPSRSSPNLNRLVGRIKGLAQRNGLRVRQYSIKELEGFFYPKGRINKRKLAEIVASEHPVLFNELDREKTNRNPYYIRMFEAVALALCVIRDA